MSGETAIKTDISYSPDADEFDIDINRERPFLVAEQIRQKC